MKNRGKKGCEDGDTSMRRPLFSAERRKAERCSIGQTTIAADLFWALDSLVKTRLRSLSPHCAHTGCCSKLTVQRKKWLSPRNEVLIMCGTLRVVRLLVGSTGRQGFVSDTKMTDVFIQGRLSGVYVKGQCRKALDHPRLHWWTTVASQNTRYRAPP